MQVASWVPMIVTIHELSKDFLLINKQQQTQNKQNKTIQPTSDTSSKHICIYLIYLFLRIVHNGTREVVFLLGGSDQRVHMFWEVKTWGQCFKHSLF